MIITYVGVELMIQDVNGMSVHRNAAMILQDLIHDGCPGTLQDLILVGYPDCRSSLVLDQLFDISIYFIVRVTGYDGCNRQSICTNVVQNKILVPLSKDCSVKQSQVSEHGEVA